MGKLARCLTSNVHIRSANVHRTDTSVCNFSAQEPVTPFSFSGTASHLGRFTGYGEAEFRPGETEGSLVGNGVAVFEAANGDSLVGAATLEIDIPANTLQAEFPWRDSVEFSDGTIVSSTGRFLTKRPPGLAVAGLWGSCFLLINGIKVPGVLILGSLCCVDTAVTGQVCKQYPEAGLSLSGTGTFTRR